MNKVFAVGISYKTAPVAIREQFAVPASGQAAVADVVLRDGNLSEVVILWTCNRMEIYGVTRDGDPDPEALMYYVIRKPLLPGTKIYCHLQADAVRHLCRVASGMDSMVLGETEITAQVKNAYENARIAGSTGKVLNVMFQKALQTAKQIRTTTAIGSGTASVGSVAVLHAQRMFGATLSGRKAMVVGAGNMAEKCLRHLVKKGVTSIVVVNRSMDRAEALAAEFSGTAVSFGRCLEAMKDVDIVITSTGSPHIILEREDFENVMAGRPERPLVVIDIAVPRDVSPQVASVPGVDLHDIGHLEETVRENIRYREQDLNICHDIIEQNVCALENRLFAVPETISI